MTISVKNMILGVCASGLAVVGAFASYTGSKYKVKTADGSFLLVRGYGCSGSGSLRCVVKVKTAHGSETVFERATLFNQHGDTVAGESYLLSTFHTLGD